MTTVNLLQAFPDVAEHYRRRFRHVLVDEYQDTNHAQYVLVRELVGAGRATERDRRPSCASSATPTSRSTPSAARRSATSSSSSRTTRTRGRSCWSRTTARRRRSCPPPTRSSTATRAASPRTCGPTRAQGAPIVGYVADNEHDEAAFVADEIDRLTDEEDVTPGDVAVFYRTNAQSRVFEEVFIRVGLPYKVVGGVRFYERQEVRDALAYLRLLANPEDTVSLRRILNVPKRGIGDRAEACLEALAAARADLVRRRRCGAARTPTGWRPGRWPTSQAFRQLMDDLRTLVEAGTGPATVLEAVLERTGYLAELAGVDRPAGRDPAREPAGAGRGRPRVRGGGRGRRSGPGRSPTSWSRSRWSPTPTRSRTSPRRAPRPRRRRHADDAAHRQGPGVPGRLPHRPGGRRLPAPAVARRPDRAGGGAPARLRRHHPRAAAALPVAGRSCAAPGGRRSTTRRRGSSRRSRPSWSTGGARSRRVAVGAGDRVGGRPVQRPVARQPGRHPPRARRPGHPRQLRDGHGGGRGGRRRAGDRVDRLPVARASSGCCCATRRSRSSEGGRVGPEGVRS